MNLNSKERDILLEALDHYSDFGGEMSDKEYELFVNLQRKNHPGRKGLMASFE